MTRRGDPLAGLFLRYAIFCLHMYPQSVYKGSPSKEHTMTEQQKAEAWTALQAHEKAKPLTRASKALLGKMQAGQELLDVDGKMLEIVAPDQTFSKVSRRTAEALMYHGLVDWHTMEVTREGARATTLAATN